MKVKFVGPDTATMNTAASVENFVPIMGMTEEEFAALAKTICVMVPHRPSEGISGGIAVANGQWARTGVAFAPVDDQFAGHIDITRACMVKEFLQYCNDRPEVDKVVMMDSDELIPWDAPYRLAAWDLPIVSGVVCSYSPGRGIWACFTVVDDYGVARFPSWNFTRNIPGKGLKEVHSVGGGLVCIKKDVFLKIIESGDYPFLIPDSIRRQAIEIGTLKYGEDTWFCKQARELGFKCHVDFGVRAVHIKSINLEWPRNAIDYDLDPREWKVDGRDYHHA